MDDLIDKLIILKMQSQLIEDNDKIIFDQEIKGKLVIIHHIVDGINDMINTYQLSDKKTEMYLIDNKKQNLLFKKLFPYYWTISQSMNQLDNNQLDELSTLPENTHLL